MPLLHRRLPRYVRPAPFFLLGLAGAWLAWVGLQIHVDVSRQTGNFFLLLSLPRTPASWDWVAGSALVLGLACLAGASGYGTLGGAALLRRSPAQLRGWLAPRLRFFPLTFFLGLFLAYFGTVFLFDASVAGDQSERGWVVFVYLNYAGLLDRPFVTALGLLLAAAGLWAALRGAFAFGLGRVDVAFPPPRAPAPRPAAPAPSAPAWAAPARPRVQAAPPGVARRPAPAPPLAAAPARPGAPQPSRFT